MSGAFLRNLGKGTLIVPNILLAKFVTHIGMTAGSCNIAVVFRHIFFDFCKFPYFDLLLIFPPL